MIQLAKVEDSLASAVFDDLAEEPRFDMPPDPFQTSGDLVRWLVYSDCDIVGYAVCHSIDWVSRRGRGGTWLRAEARGHGIGKAVTTALHAAVFGELNLRRIEGAVENSNAAQQRILEGLGMRCEGIMRDVAWFNGKYRTFVLYALVRAEVK